MPNAHILRAVTSSWRSEAAGGRKVLDSSCGGGDTARKLAGLGFEVVATDYGAPPPIEGVKWRIAGVDLNEFLPFRDACFEGVNLVEVIEHIEHQAQLVREIARVLKPGGVLLVSTPNVLNAFSRLRFLFTGFLRGRVRPVHYSRGPGQAPNIYLIHFYELYYLLFHYGFAIEELRATRIKFAPLFFAALLFPLMCAASLEAVIRAEKDPVQRAYNWRILRHMLSPALLLSDNIVVKARKAAT
ncbi:MAG TPA: methyltransferase domain-containing protein [candidate division Zixibacteria bacterium]|nr:methyltransferase domain-containing protein [candidate division Zixibacteria bacterium]